MHLTAPAKLTLSLRISERRSDGMHEVDAEMATIDLCDHLEIAPGTGGAEVVDVDGSPVPGVPKGPGNLVDAALRLAGRQATVRVVKRIPPGGGLGGGSADAGAVLRWAGWQDLDAAVGLGSDVPFCVVGGRARVRGTGEQVEPLPYRSRALLVLLPPLRVDTGAVFRAFDQLEPTARRDPATDHPNDLTTAALQVEPRLERWRAGFEVVTGTAPILAGSGSTWFVPCTERDAEGVLDRLPTDEGGHRYLEVDGARGRVLTAATVPAGWEMPPGANGHR